MPFLNNCCCCCNLRTGGIILGWLGLVSAIFQLIAFSVSWEYIMQLKPENFDPETFKQIARLSLGTAIFGCIVAILMNFLLIWGSFKGKRLLLLPWLFTVGAGLVIIILGIFVIGGIAFSDQNTIGIGIAMYLFYLPLAGLEIYFWMCVLSLFQKLREEDATLLMNCNEENGLTTGVPYRQL